MREWWQFRQQRSWAVLAMVVLALVSCKEKATDTAMVADPVVLIGRENIAVAKLEELRSGPSISGSLEAKTEATVKAQFLGQVERTFADEGQRVRRGVSLAQLDDNAVRDAYLSARSAVRSAESTLQIARRNAERARTACPGGRGAGTRPRDRPAGRHQRRRRPGGCPGPAGACRRSSSRTRGSARRSTAS